MSDHFHSLTVRDVRRETADAVSIGLAVPPDLTDRFAFRAGQHVTLRAVIDGEELRRNYSLCVAPGDGEWRVAIKRVADGRFSGWAAEALSPGDAIDVLPPHGSFTAGFDPSRAQQYLGVAAGSGITPILSLMKEALATEPESGFTLLYGNRHSGSILFLDELSALKDRYMGRLRIHHFLSAEDEEVALFNGRLDAGKMADILDGLVDASAIDTAFLCGPAGMMDAAEQALSAAGMSAGRILSERFTAGEQTAEQRAAVQRSREQAGGRPVQLVLDGRRRTLRFNATLGSILDNARAAGLPAPFACKAGVCATCRARVVSGEVAMAANYGLSAEEVAGGYVLTCQAVPVGDDVVLDYDA